MRKQELAAGIIVGSAIFTKKTGKFSLTLLKVAFGLTILLGADYIAHKQLYDNHYNFDEGMKFKTYLSMASPFTYYLKSSEEETEASVNNPALKDGA